jgi:hypothetical protein
MNEDFDVFLEQLPEEWRRVFGSFGIPVVDAA